MRSKSASMMPSRRRFLFTGTAAAAAAWVRFPAGAAEFSYKFATEQPADHHMTLRLNAAVDKIRTDSGGRLDIRVFPSSALGGQSDMITQIRIGAVELITSDSATLSSVVPISGIFGIPFIFDGPKQALATAAGPLGKYRRDTIGKIGVYVFAQQWNEGFRQVVNGVRPVATPADMNGLKLRIPISPVTVDLFKALGASPTAVSSNEMYTAMKTRLVDGCELPLGAIEAYKIFEVEKYVSYTNHVWTNFSMMINQAAWQKLPQNLRDMLERTVNQAGLLDNADVIKAEETLETTLKGQGMSFNRADSAAFRAVVRQAGLYAKWRETYGPDSWALLEKSVGKLG